MLYSVQNPKLYIVLRAVRTLEFNSLSAERSGSLLYFLSSDGIPKTCFGLLTNSDKLLLSEILAED